MLKSENVHFRATPKELLIVNHIMREESLNLSEAVRQCIRDAGRMRNFWPPVQNQESEVKKDGETMDK